MTQDELSELNAQVEAVSVQDVHLGRVLKGFLAHLADLAGVSLEPAPVVEEEPMPLPSRVGRRQP